ncbi:hypothetical protein J2S13_000449 [Oikeobacillus pervagus]|uniref:Uncharacterized protein n=1 Tax=Oikeobacillus pervagus TaxID=1325931 RepID=A0AAJ1SWV8_9BACI|nr:hypothetical protein [Oikeobacillus pervagus]MDQ0214054.1 hypothetical protein [Oikeobacillus pervagus]
MGKWNEEAAPNNQMHSSVIRSSKLIEDKKEEKRGFQEALSDGGERNEIIEQQIK